MKKGGKKQFIDKELREEMFRLRRGGATCEAIAIQFGCHHTSVSHLCLKYGVVPEKGVLISRNFISRIISDVLGKMGLTAPLPGIEWRTEGGERVSVGRKSYRERLEELRNSRK